MFITCIYPNIYFLCIIFHSVGEIMGTFFRTLELRKNRWDGDLGSVPLRFDKPSSRLYELTSEDVQSGLQDFVEKHRKLKQMDLIKHMSQHNQQNQQQPSGFENKPVVSIPVSGRVDLEDIKMHTPPIQAGNRANPSYSGSGQAPGDAEGHGQPPLKKIVPPRMHEPSLDIIID